MKINKRNFPEELFYDTHYQWIKREGNRIRFGLTPYGLEITGDILYLSLPDVGARVDGDGSCGSLEAGKWVGRVYAPVSGKVIKVNEDVVSNPALVSQDPYGYWFAEIEIMKSEEMNVLMSAADLCAWIAEDRKVDA